MRHALPVAMLCLWLWAGFLPYFAEANHGERPGDNSSLCFGDDSLFKKCNCICYAEGNGLCGVGGQHIQCADVPCEEELERFAEFPRLNLDFDPNITCLEIENFQFTQLTYSDLNQFPNLLELQLEHGQLQIIDNDAFNATPRLEFLDLDDNQLTSWPPVAGLSELHLFGVQDNRIPSLEPGDLSGCYDLANLNAANNNIRRLSNGVFEDNCLLQTLNLNGNELDIEEDVFEGLHNMKSLSLSNALISKLPVNGLRALETLDLSLARNYREEFPVSAFPLLERVSFFYHAFCCQLEDHRYLVPFTRDPGPGINETAVLQDAEPDSSTESELLCFNTTSREMINNSIRMDSQNLTVEQFCEDYCDLQPGICGGCGMDSGLASSMELDIICVQRPIPTPSSCYSTETFSSQITTTVCSTAVASPSPSHTVVATPSPSHTTLPAAPGRCSAKQIDVVCRNATNSTNPTAPTPIDPCDNGDNNYCETLDPTILTPTQCEHCRDFGGSDCDLNSQPPGTCALLIIHNRLHADLCQCHMRKKRSASTLSLSSLKDSRYQRHLRSAASDCIPEGWFPPDPNSTDVICSIVTPAPAPSPMPPATCPVAAVNVSGFVPGPNITCSPIPDAFNPCVDLLGDADILRVAIWLVIVMSLVMNMIVIVVTVGYSFILRRAKQDLFIMHFLYLNLAIADFLMGVYLLTLASVDLDTLGSFAASALKWQTGPGCRFAGFCAITSTVVSVYTLVVITLERAYTIINVMHRRKFSRIMVFVVMILGWLLGIVMGILPMVGVSDYSRVAVCLPFDVSTRLAKGYVAFLLLATGLAFIVIMGSYILIFYEVTCSGSKRRLRTGSMKTVWNQELRVGLRMFLLVFTNFVCWFPIALLGLSAAFGETLVSVETSKVIIVFIFPLNACVNPILYSVSTTKFRQNFCLLLGRCGLFKGTNARIISHRHGFPSHTSQSSNQSTPRGYLRRLSTRLLSLSSLPSASNSKDDQRDSRVLGNRRDSNYSQGSYDDQRNLMAARRSSNFSTLSNNSSNEDPGAGHRGLRRNSALSDSSQEEQATSFSNPNYRPSSPTAGRDEKDVRQRLGTKISVSSLGTLPEEIEIAPTPVNEVVKNLGYADVEDEEGYYTEQKDSSDSTPDSNTESLVHKSGVIDPQYLHHQIIELPNGHSPGSNEDVQTAVIDTSNNSSQFETESMKEEIAFD